MSEKFLKDEISKISLTNNQKDNAKKHFENIKKDLEKLDGVSSVEIQGSFGRGTVINGQEKDGFDLDIAVLVSKKNIFNSQNINDKIEEILNKIYDNKEIKIKSKSIQIDIKSNFNIDITQIYKDENEESVFNSKESVFEKSYSLEFKNKFIEANKSSNNSLVYLSRIYKHIRDSIKDFPEFKSIALDIILYRSLDIQEGNMVQTMLNTLKKSEKLIESKFKNSKGLSSISKIENPMCDQDFISTGLNSEEDIDKVISLNRLVFMVIEQAFFDQRKFSHLERRFNNLIDIQDNYSEKSILPIKDNKINSHGVYGGNKMGKNK